MVDRPSEHLARLLSGRQSWDDAPESIRSWAAFYIHDAAKQVISLATPEKRRAALATLPDTIRPRVEDEVRRIWPLRDR
jgi:hypothetical protein